MLWVRGACVCGDGGGVTGFPWTPSSSIPRVDLRRPCPVCKAPAWCLCVSEETGEPTPHAIHAGRLALKPRLRPGGIPGFFSLEDESENS